MWLIRRFASAASSSPGMAIGISTTVYLGAGAVTRALAGGLRLQVRTLWVVVGDTDCRTAGWSGKRSCRRDQSGPHPLDAVGGTAGRRGVWRRQE
ncbi:hypothetical protein [Mycobacterium sp.]|uniref:hypothetical protein n=1 Tax=Mycobacterium sp. TaxID=1785 RepID=UPI003F9AECD8